MSDIPKARPASTVVLLRDTSQGLQTLMLKRNKALLFAGGAWVFPGGSLDPEDMEAGNGDVIAASRIAAAREAQEESGLSPRLEDMVLLSHWTTPEREPKRFSTWIYAAPLPADVDVEIDGSEIHDSRWIGVSEAVGNHERGELAMLPPTYVTLLDLARYDSVAGVLAGEALRLPDEVFPIFGEDGGRPIVMFRGDAGYDAGDGSQLGARHRAVLCGESWQYVHENVDPEFPSFIH